MEYLYMLISFKMSANIIYKFYAKKTLYDCLHMEVEGLKKFKTVLLGFPGCNFWYECFTNMSFDPSSWSFNKSQTIADFLVNSRGCINSCDQCERPHGLRPEMELEPVLNFVMVTTLDQLLWWKVLLFFSSVCGWAHF